MGLLGLSIKAKEKVLEVNEKHFQPYATKQALRTNPFRAVCSWAVCAWVLSALILTYLTLGSWPFLVAMSIEKEITVYSVFAILHAVTGVVSVLMSDFSK